MSLDTPSHICCTVRIWCPRDTTAHDSIVIGLTDSMFAKCVAPRLVATPKKCNELSQCSVSQMTMRTHNSIIRLIKRTPKIADGPPWLLSTVRETN